MSKPNFNKLLVASAMLANILEFYELTVFGFLAPLMLTQASAAYSFGSKVMGFAMFSIAFFFRPLGAVIFGHIGDKYGRKIALYLCIILMGAATFLIGCLPIDSHFLTLIVALTALRSLQGISAGGEFSGSMIFVLENSPSSKPYGLSSLIGSGAAIGLLVGSVVAYIILHSNNPTWNWRYAFWSGIVLALVAIWIRTKLYDPYAEQVKQAPVKKAPLLEVIKTNPFEILTCISVSALSGTLIYWSSFLTSIGEKKGGLPIAQILFVFLFPLSGLLADRFGANKTRAVALTLILVTIAVCLLPEVSHQIEPLILTVTLCIGTSLFVGQMHFFMFNLFEQRMRYSGLAVSYSIGMGAIGGLAPLLAQITFESFENHIFINAYIISLSLLAMFFILKLKGGKSERTNSRLMEQPA